MKPKRNLANQAVRKLKRASPAILACFSAAGVSRHCCIGGESYAESGRPDTGGQPDKTMTAILMPPPRQRWSNPHGNAMYPL